MHWPTLGGFKQHKDNKPVIFIILIYYPPQLLIKQSRCLRQRMYLNVQASSNVHYMQTWTIWRGYDSPYHWKTFNWFTEMIVHKWRYLAWLRVRPGQTNSKHWGQAANTPLWNSMTDCTNQTFKTANTKNTKAMTAQKIRAAYEGYPSSPNQCLPSPFQLFSISWQSS